MFEWNDGNYLAHHGVPEQKWGIRRYQYEDGSLTPLGREHYGIGPKRENWGDKTREKEAKKTGSLLDSYKQHRKDKKRADNLKKARAAKQKKAEDAKRAEEEAKKAEAKKIEDERIAKENAAAEKERIRTVIRSGTAEEVLNELNNLSNAQLQEAYDRLQNESKIRGMLPKAPKEQRKIDKMASFFNDVGKVGTMVETGTKTWNSVAKVINSFSDKKLKVIGDKGVKELSKTEISRMIKDASGDVMKDVVSDAASVILAKIRAEMEKEK